MEFDKEDLNVWQGARFLARERHENALSFVFAKPTARRVPPFARGTFPWLAEVASIRVERCGKDVIGGTDVIWARHVHADGSLITPHARKTLAYMPIPQSHFDVAPRWG